jgi:MATE family, multidrug efflux pump
MGMSITDTVMMGWMGRGALAAGAVVSDVYSIVFYFMAGIVSIVSPLVARAVGADNPEDARRAIHHGLAATCVIAVPAFAAVWYAPEFIGIFGVERAVVSMGKDYAHSLAFAVVPMLFVAVWRNMFDAIGRPRIYLVAILLALPLNAGANQVLMFGLGPIPAFGLAGAGIGSAVVAFALFAGFIVFSTLNAEVRQLRLFEGGVRIEVGLLAETFRLGLPIGFFTIGEVGIFLLATVVVSLFGVEALAAHAITLRVAGVIYAIPVGLSQAATVRVGRAIGMGDAQRLERVIKSARTVGAVSGVLILSTLVVAAGLLPGWRGGEGARPIVTTAASLLVLLGILNFAQGFAAPATAVLRAFKETRTPMFLCLAGYWLIGMPIAMLTAFEFDQGAWGIWAGLASGVVANALLMNLRLGWRLRRSH